MTDEELEACAVCGAILDALGNCDNPACDTNAEVDLEEDLDEDEDIEDDIDWPDEDEDDEEESVT